MKTTKTYPVICNHCNGKGQVAYHPDSTNPYTICPLCRGSGSIIVTETQETQDVAFTQDIKEIK
jgi:DnaJ-class molecular chaperone